MSCYSTVFTCKIHIVGQQKYSICLENPQSSFEKNRINVGAPVYESAETEVQQADEARRSKLHLGDP